MWSTTKGDEEKTSCFEKRALWQIYGSVLENKVYWRKINREIQGIYKKKKTCINNYEQTISNEHYHV